MKEVVSSVLEGQGISWLKHSRVKKLLEDENYRNFVVSRLNRNLDKKLTDDDHHIEDVVSIVLVLKLTWFPFMLTKINTVYFFCTCKGHPEKEAICDN